MFNPKQNILDQQLEESGLVLHITFGDVGDFFGDVGNVAGDVLTGGALSQNKVNRKNAANQNKVNKKIHKFNKEEAERANAYAAEGLKITKGNNKRNRKYEKETLNQAYKHGKAVNKYEHQQAKRAYTKSKTQATQQLNFNDLAERQSLLDQDRFLAEQLVDLELDERQSLADYRFAAAGINLKKKQARAEAKFAVQRSSLQSLKARGQAAARGQAGQSAAAVQRGIAAEVGANQAEIIQTLISTEQGLDVDLLQLKDQLITDQMKLQMSGLSLRAADAATRRGIALAKRQADLNAEASILLKPEKQPPLPKPVALPKVEYQDIYERKAPPRAARIVAQQQNLVAAGINTVAGYASAAMGIYNQGKTAGFWGQD